MISLPVPIRKLLIINTSDEDVSRRGRNVIVVSLAIIVLALVLNSLTLLQIEPVIQELDIRLVILTVVTVAFHTGVIALSRRGNVNVAAWIMVTLSILSVLGNLLTITEARPAPLYTLVPVLLASAVLSSRTVWIAGGAILGVLAIVLAVPNPLVELALRQELTFTVAVLVVITTFVSSLNSASIERALRQLRASRTEVQQSAALLEQTNNTLEARVAQRTAELEHALALQQMQATELTHALATQQQLSDAIKELSLPILPVRDDVLVVPLIGALDTNRTQDLLERVLHQIEHTSARFLILDVTGVPVIDTQVGQGLLQTAAAAQLIGAKTMLVGIRLEVAQALVGLGMELNALETQATLQQGLDMIAG